MNPTTTVSRMGRLRPSARATDRSAAIRRNQSEGPSAHRYSGIPSSKASAARQRQNNLPNNTNNNNTARLGGGQVVSDGYASARRTMLAPAPPQRDRGDRLPKVSHPSSLGAGSSVTTASLGDGDSHTYNTNSIRSAPVTSDLPSFQYPPRNGSYTGGGAVMPTLSPAQGGSGGKGWMQINEAVSTGSSQQSSANLYPTRSGGGPTTGKKSISMVSAPPAESSSDSELTSDRRAVGKRSTDDMQHLMGNDNHHNGAVPFMSKPRQNVNNINTRLQISHSEEDLTSATTPLERSLGHSYHQLQPVYNNNSNNRQASMLTTSPIPTPIRPQPSAFDHPPIGLRNFGSTCYMNATLQCLLHAPRFLSMLEDDVRRVAATSPRNRTAALQKRRSFLAVHKPATSSLIELGLQQPRTPPGQLLLSVKGSAASYNEEFSSNGQNDAHEFLRTILYVIHDEVNRGAGRSAPYEELKDIDTETDEEAMVRWTQHISTVDDSTVYDHFGGVLRSRCECLTCGNRSLTFDPFLDLSLPVANANGPRAAAAAAARGGGAATPEAIDIILRKQFVSNTHEQLKGGNQLLCVKCKKLRDGVRCSSVVRWPKILVLHLKRFNGQGRKNNAPVVYPYTFMLDGALRYRLFAVCCHSGSENYGHYTSYVCVQHQGTTQASNINNNTNNNANPFADRGRLPARGRGNAAAQTWYQCNDDRISTVDAKVATSALSEAYILFYCQEE